MTKSYKTSYWLQVYPSIESTDGTALVVEDFYAKKTFLLEHPAFFQILSFCNVFQFEYTIEDYIINVLEFSKKESEELISQLVSCGLILEKDAKAHEIEESAYLWKKYSWDDALDYFIAMKDYPFLDYESESANAVDNEMMDGYINHDKVPQIYKNYAVPQIYLERDDDALDGIGIKEVLVEEVFDTSASSKPLSKSTLSNLLQYTFGKTGLVEFPVQGEFLMKTSPSGGARHPIEAYVMLIDTDLGQGLFHYSVEHHALEKMEVSLSEDELREIIYELKTGPQFKPKAVIIFSAAFPRSMWRYREPRSYRVVLHDLGHLLETMKVVSKSLTINTYYGHGFQDTAIEKALNLDSSTESVLKFAAIG